MGTPTPDDAYSLQRAFQARGWNVQMHVIDGRPEDALVKVIPRITISDLLELGILHRGQEITTEFKGQRFIAIIEDQDTIRLKGIPYPTFAATSYAVQKAVLGHHDHITDGWGDWVLPSGRVLASLRRELAGVVSQEIEGDWVR